MSIMKFIATSPDVPITKGEEEIDSSFRKFRREVLFAIFFSYVVFYLTRRSFAAAIPAMLEQTALTAADFGFMSSIFYILYGAMKFAGGVIVDRVNPKAMIVPALIGVGILNLIFGSSDSVTAFYVLFAMNALVQGTSFPPMAKLMASWFSKNERGKWWAVVEAAHNVGGALAPILTGFAISLTGSWRMGFYVPGAISLAMGIIALFTLRDHPRAEGLPNVGEWRKDEAEKAHSESSPSNLKLSTIFWRYIVKNPLVWLVIGGDMCVYIARTLMMDWPSIYFKQVHGWELVKANSISAWFETGGFFGGLLAGVLSDKLFKANRWMTGLLFGIALCLLMLLVVVFQDSSYTITASLFGVMGFALYGPHMLFAVGCLEVTHKEAAGSVTGFRGMFSYIGAALTGAPVVAIRSHWAWEGVFVYAFVSVLVMTICLAFLARMHKLR